MNDPVLGWRLAPSRETSLQGARLAVHVSQNAGGGVDRALPPTRANAGRRRILVWAMPVDGA